MRRDPVAIDWDVLRHVCNLPGASPEVHMRRDDVAAIVAFVDLVREHEADMPDGLMVSLYDISGPTPSPALAYMNRLASKPSPVWVEDDELDERRNGW